MDTMELTLKVLAKIRYPSVKFQSLKLKIRAQGIGYDSIKVKSVVYVRKIMCVRLVLVQRIVCIFI